MIIVFIGGSGSGKSEYAENTALQVNKGRLLYIATMQPFDDECKERVKQHQHMRRSKDFKTIECYTGLEKMIIQKDTTALLECMSNLVANEMFSSEHKREHIFDAIKQGVSHLAGQTDNLLIVTNNIFEDGFSYDEETMRYMKLLGDVNQWLCQIADKVVWVVHGIPVELKNSPNHDLKRKGWNEG